MSKDIRKIKAGNVLIAEPFMLDPNFKKSVILMCEHNDGGSLGFILNKPINMNINELVDDFPEFSSSLYYGGPVAADTLHYIHNVGEILDESLKIQQGVYWGGDFEKLKFLIENELILPKNIKFFVGYSGWSEKQLESELETGSWVISDMDANYAFKTKSYQLWTQALENKGDNYSVIAQISGDNKLN